MINLIKFQIKRLITMLVSLVFKTRVGKFASEKLINLSLNSEKEIYYIKNKFENITGARGQQGNSAKFIIDHY